MAPAQQHHWFQTHSKDKVGAGVELRLKLLDKFVADVPVPGMLPSQVD